jgi:ABC-type nitrate/sulfonate/bicarbonate transport system ATPase subunit
MINARLAHEMQKQHQPSAKPGDRSAFSQPKMEVCGVYKSFQVQGKPLMVLQNIDLQLYPGEFICLVGASGCGKSTLLNIVAGLDSPSAGQIVVDGEPVTGPGSDRGMVFQGYTLYPWLTVSNNIAFGLKLRGMRRAEIRERVSYYLDVVGLTPFAKAYPKQLSGGMKQRVAIARALANEPQVLLMDEPFGALDAQTKEQMQQFLLELWERTHTSVMMITHDVEEAIFLSQRIYVMSRSPGRIKLEVPVNLPLDRDLEIKLSAEFVAIKRDIIHALRADEGV